MQSMERMGTPVGSIGSCAVQRCGQEGEILSPPEAALRLEVGDGSQSVDRYEPFTISLSKLVISVAGLGWINHVGLKQPDSWSGARGHRTQNRVGIRLPEQALATYGNASSVRSSSGLRQRRGIPMRLSASRPRREGHDGGRVEGDGGVIQNSRECSGPLAVMARTTRTFIEDWMPNA
jgi:hypothetical protein